jgi:hypothetical protein
LDLEQRRLDLQADLRRAGTPRASPIRVTTEGVIWDGHHAVRLAAERGEKLDVLVVPVRVAPSGVAILELPVR